MIRDLTPHQGGDSHEGESRNRSFHHRARDRVHVHEPRHTPDERRRGPRPAVAGGAGSVQGGHQDLNSRSHPQAVRAASREVEV